MLRQRKLWFLLAIFALLLAGAILAFVSLRQPVSKEQTYEHVEQSFNEIPVYTNAKLIYQRYYGCTECRFAGMMALYSTDISPEEVSAFYKKFFQSSSWSYGGDWMGESDGQITQWGLDAERPFGDSLQEEKVTLIASESKTTSELWFTPKEATRKAISTGKTVYIIAVYYTQNKEISMRKCPPDIFPVCENSWWEIDNP